MVATCSNQMQAKHCKHTLDVGGITRRLQMVDHSLLQALQSTSKPLVLQPSVLLHPAAGVSNTYTNKKPAIELSTVGHPVQQMKNHRKPAAEQVLELAFLGDRVYFQGEQSSSSRPQSEAALACLNGNTTTLLN